MITFPDPLRIAAGTFLVRPLYRPPGATASLHLNSMVMLGREPLIVDTGVAIARDEWCEQVFGLVDPDDVRWVFLSHDDIDHSGNVATVMDLCPQATLVTSGIYAQRMGAGLDVPRGRQRWINDGESFWAGDRQLVAVRPPLFDSPATRGLYDATTGVYWTSDAFGTPVIDVVEHVDELPPDVWAEGSAEFAMMLSPWLAVADPAAFGVWVDRIEALRADVMVGTHGPVLSGPSIEAALARVRLLPGTAEVSHPGHDVLEEVLTLLA